MCDSQYKDPHWGAMARYALGPANNAYYKQYQQSSPGMTDGMFITSNEYGYNQMYHGNNYSLPYNNNIQYFSPIISKVSNFPKLQDQVDACTRITYQPHGCNHGAVSQVYTDAKDYAQHHPQAMSEFQHFAGTHTPHPYGISYDTGAPVGMAQVRPSGSGSFN
ncbi:hypothetical protein DRO61_10950 [Candidatus Bathyarchaeota archaeon]|nr:MAG: hypothetical protein DRO61_10950 [Candidatus Bathyarchaeota archaeon]